jgi:hypothetical protein
MLISVTSFNWYTLSIKHLRNQEFYTLKETSFFGSQLYFLELLNEGTFFLSTYSVPDIFLGSDNRVTTRQARHLPYRTDKSGARWRTDNKHIHKQLSMIL